MKKIFIILMAAMVAAGSVYAADNSKKTAKSKKAYNMSIGMVAGSGIGVQLKDMITDHFTIIEEFGYLGSYCAAGNGFNWSTLGAVDNLVLAYQAKGAEGQGIELDWFVGGQLKGGFLGGNNGLIGVGAAVGLEGIMKNAPIAFSFDFRPGYGCVLGSNGWGGVGAFHVFDWTLNLGVRYKF
jgi:hypothetical protein